MHKGKTIRVLDEQTVFRSETEKGERDSASGNSLTKCVIWKESFGGSFINGGVIK